MGLRLQVKIKLQAGDSILSWHYVSIPCHEELIKQKSFTACNCKTFLFYAGK